LPDFVEALLIEIDLQKDFFQKNTTIETLYFGGGTPSLLIENQVDTILNSLYKNFSIKKDAEITLEANPDDLTLEKLQSFKQLGINRLSIGIQSFIDKELQLINRAHKAQEGRLAIQNAQQIGFNNISIDLIFNLPNQRLADFEYNLSQALHYQPQHISIYGLTIEPKTKLAHQIQSNKIQLPDEEIYTKQYELIQQTLSENGFEHYEISNFALPNYRSRHNSAYWQQKHYLGLGPSAHSFDNQQRIINIPNIHQYCNSLKNNQLPIHSTEILSNSDKANEIILTHLRTIEGLNLNALTPFISPKTLQNIIQTIQSKELSELCIFSNNTLQLTPNGKLFADFVTQKLISL